jgi:outer membrane protein OmpA-like peptidoglycan-associated protein
MKLEPYLRIEVYGHTDNAGDEKKNKELSLNRARAVVDYLVSRGVKSAHVSAEGFGSSKPLVPNNTEEGKKRNRRVEFVLKN